MDTFPDHHRPITRHRAFQGLPIPHRQPIIMACHSPIVTGEKIAEPTQEQIDALHSKVVLAHKQLFNSIKGLVGQPYADKELVIDF